MKKYFILAALVVLLASCSTSNEGNNNNTNTNQLKHGSLSITTTKSFIKDQQIKLFNDSTFKLSATFEFELKSVSYGIDGEFTVSQVAPKENSWGQEVTLDPLIIKNGIHTLKVIGTPKMDGVSTEQEMKFEVIDKPTFTILYDRKNTTTKQPIKVSTSSPVENITMILPDGSKQPFNKQSPTSFSLETIIPKGEEGLCKIQSTDEYGNSVSESIFVDIAEKRLWFINSGFNEKQQINYHQLVSCNTDLQDVVVHMDTDEFEKLAADSEDTLVLKGESSSLKLQVTNLYGISPDKRYLFIAIESNTQNALDYQMKVLKVNGFPTANVDKIKYIVYDIEQRNVLFNKYSYYFQYRDHGKDIQTNNGIDYSPLYFKDDSLYMIEQKRKNEYIDNKITLPDIIDIRINYRYESQTFVVFSITNSTYKSIDPLFDLLPWMTFTTQELGLVGMAEAKYIKKYYVPILPVNSSDIGASVSSVINLNNGSKFDVVELNRKLCGDKYEIIWSGFLGAYSLKGKYYVIYSVVLKEYDILNRKIEGEYNPPKHYYLVSLDTDDVKELSIDKQYNQYLRPFFVRSNSIDNEKAFFYLIKEPVSNEKGIIIKKEQCVKATIDGEKVDFTIINPAPNVIRTYEEIIGGFKTTPSVFYQ